jgi:hypothetical protein
MDSIYIVAYDGHRAGVRPKALIEDGLRREVLEIERAWVETGEDPSSPVIHAFFVRCEGGARYRVLHHSDAGWSAMRLPGPWAVR